MNDKEVNINQLALTLAKHSANSIVIDKYHRDATDLDVEHYFNNNKSRFLEIAQEVYDQVRGMTDWGDAHWDE